MIRPITRANYFCDARPPRRLKRTIHVFLTRFAFVLFALAFSLFPQAAQAQPASLRKGEDLRKAMEEESFAATWQGLAARDAMQRLTNERRIATWLDRRIDPDQLLEIVIPDDTLEVGCRRLAAKMEAAVCRVDGVLYFGPADAVRRLPTIAALCRAEVEQKLADRRATLVAPRAMEWPELSEPRALVARLATEAGLEVRDLDKRVPYDLWPARRLPPLAWADRLTLVLAGFDLTFAVTEGGAIEIVPFPAAPKIERTITPKGVAARVAAEIGEKYPDVEAQAVGAKLRLRGRYEDVEVAERLALGQRVKRTQVRDQGKVFTMKVDQQQAGRVLSYIAEQQRLTLEISNDAQELLAKPVTFSVENASLADLLSTTVRGTGLQIDLRESRVIVTRSP